MLRILILIFEDAVDGKRFFLQVFDKRTQNVAMDVIDNWYVSYGSLGQ